MLTPIIRLMLFMSFASYILAKANETNAFPAASADSSDNLDMLAPLNPKKTSPHLRGKLDLRLETKLEDGSRVLMNKKTLAAYYCTPETCYSTSGGSINPAATDVLASFVLVNSDSSLSFDLDKATVESWQASGMKVSIVLGGATQNKDYIFNNMNQVITNLVNLVFSLGADGINLDLEGLTQEQMQQYQTFISNLAAALPNNYLLTLAPECVGIYCDASAAYPYNGYVDLINTLKDKISGVLIQPYNNWCNAETAGSVLNLEEVLSTWINACPAVGYNGLAAEKTGLIFLGSPEAGGSGYASPETVDQVIQDSLNTYGSVISGYWDTFYDWMNGMRISYAAAWAEELITYEPSGQPTSQPSMAPSTTPTSAPTSPTGTPTSSPTAPSGQPSAMPSAAPTVFTPANSLPTWIVPTVSGAGGALFLLIAFVLYKRVINPQEIKADQNGQSDPAQESLLSNNPNALNSNKTKYDPYKDGQAPCWNMCGMYDLLCSK